jgi:hypothetical protein
MATIRGPPIGVLGHPIQKIIPFTHGGGSRGGAAHRDHWIHGQRFQGDGVGQIGPVPPELG